jgi:phosphoserine phosphatase RsbU/P
MSADSGSLVEGAMATVANNYFQGALEERKKLLSAAISGTAADERLVSLLSEVDAALRRLAAGTFGLCEECHDSVEQERLIADPLVRFCLDHLTAKERRALEADLEQAATLQKSLLPARDSRAAGWHVHYHYRPAGPVSGDYCDVILENGGGGGVFFLVGDVAGKGVSACLLMTQLHGMFRSLISVRMPLVDLLGAANRLLCETATAGQYATLVCGRSGVDGDVEIASAGHLPVWVGCAGGLRGISATGLPLGLFRNASYTTEKFRALAGETLVVYTDGLSEARDSGGNEYGGKRVNEFLAGRHHLAPAELSGAFLEDLRGFCGGRALTDDLTLMVVRREV